MNFSDLKLNQHLLDKVQQRGFVEATPIQEKTIPLALSHKDILACAKTGSGKTLAFLLPVIDRLMGEMTDLQESRPRGPRALVIAPTRELALQIHEEAEYLLQGTPLKSVAIFGGVDYEKQKNELRKNPELLVATPGRLLDYIQSGDLTLGYVHSVVLDEADRMLDMGFIDDVRKIFAATREGRHVQLFSATMDYGAIYSVWEYMNEPEEVMINPELIDHARIDQKLLHLGRDEKLPFLIQYIEESKFEPIIIFTNSKNYVDVLVQNLVYHNIPAQGLSSVVNQKRRIKILEEFKEKQFRVLVATDVASRGLHIEDVQLVINFDIPQDPESYVHRIGRTARAGKTGMAISICSELDYDNLARLERYLKYKIEVMQPEERYLENMSFVRLVAAPSRTERESERNRSAGRRERSSKSHKLQPRSTHERSRRKSGQERPRQERQGERLPRPQRQLAQDRLPRDAAAIHEPVVVARSLKSEKTFWQRILSFFRLGKKHNPPPMSDKTRALLEREAQQVQLRHKERNHVAARNRRRRNHSGNRRKK